MSEYMATLAVGISARLRKLLAAQTLEDLTRQRVVTTGELTTVTDEAALQAAAEVEAALGDSLLDTDTQALAIGTKFALLDLSATYTLSLPDSALVARDKIEALLQRLADARVLAQGAPATAREDFAALDAAYPGSTWTNEHNDEIIL